MNLPQILLVEDNLYWRTMLQEILEDEGHKVVTAIAYGTAHGKLQKASFGLIVTDLRLGPDDSPKDFKGIALLKDARERGIPTIVVTGYPNVGLIRRAYKEYGVVQFCEKGNFDEQLFRESVSQVLPRALNDEYCDFDLHIAPNGHTIAHSPQGQIMADISTTVPRVIQSKLTRIEQRRTNAGLLKQVGQKFYDWLFPDPIHTHFQQTEAVARSQGVKMRVRLRIEADTIARLPLEFTYRTTGGYFMSVNPDTVLSHYLNLPLPPERVRRREGLLHLLTIIANPSDQTRLDPDEWEAIMREALTEPVAQGRIILHTIKRATLRNIRNALLRRSPDIIQFVGHGIYQGGKGYLALVDEVGTTKLVDDERFASLFLSTTSHLGLIGLATCDSAKSDSPQGFLGIAPQLVQRGTPAVVAMQYPVYIKTAKIFLENFYTAVASRKPVDWATQWARNAISQELGLNNREFAAPVLYMRAKDGRVF